MLSRRFLFLRKKDAIPESDEATPGFILSGTRYKIGSILGEGSFGKVFKATNEGKYYAVKICEHKEENDKIRNQREADVLDAIYKFKATEYLLYSVESFCHGSHFVFVIEELGISLHEEVVVGKSGPLKPQKIKNIVNQVLLGSNALLSIGFVHRDIKMENILYCKGNRLRVKLVDFGLTVPWDDIANVPCGGSLAYIAPESVLGYPCTEKIDTWGIGCVLFALFTGFEMFSPKTKLELMQQFLKIFEDIPEELEEGDNYDAFFKKDSVTGEVYLKESTRDAKLRWKPHDSEGFSELMEFGYCNFALEEPSEMDRELEEKLLNFLEIFLQPAPSKRPNPHKVLEMWNKSFQET